MKQLGNISSGDVKAKVVRVCARVFEVVFDSTYDRAMTFLRCQERFESVKFRNKDFTVLEFMRWYSHSSGHKKPHFTYPSDWTGFNLKSTDVERCLHAGVSDWNHYDTAMQDVYTLCRREVVGDEEFYLIACDADSWRHEMAHATYYISKEYRLEANKLVAAMPAAQRRKLHKHLVSVGYARNTLRDETQAYMATGLPAGLSKLKGLKAAQKPFVDLYRGFEQAGAR